MTEPPNETEPGGDAEPAAVVLAYVHGDYGDRVSYSWHRSIIEMMGWDLANHARVVRGGHISMRCGTDGLVDCRNKAVATFLAEHQADWLFWVDTDMGFAPDTLDRLMDVADPVTRPIVGALCFSQREREPDGMGGWRCTATPTVFDWARVPDPGGGEDQMGFAVRWNYPPDTVTPSAGTGSAAIVIHRSVFELVREKYAHQGQLWYDRVPNTSTGQIVSEDLSFCLRAGSLGVPIYVHTGVQTTHHKSLWLAEDDYWRQRAVSPPPVDAAPPVEAPAGAGEPA